MFNFVGISLYYKKKFNFKNLTRTQRGKYDSKSIIGLTY